jgi:hypothetical protein
MMGGRCVAGSDKEHADSNTVEKIELPQAKYHVTILLK